MGFTKIEAGYILPGDLEDRLATVPQCSGHLQKLSSSWPNQWQSRYFQLYGHFLVYFDFGQQTTSIRGNSGMIVPQGYLRLTEVDCIVISDSGSNIILQSQRHNIRLRTQVNSKVSEDPYLSEWLRHLEICHQSAAGVDSSSTSGSSVIDDSSTIGLEMHEFKDRSVSAEKEPTFDINSSNSSDDRLSLSLEMTGSEVGGGNGGVSACPSLIRWSFILTGIISKDHTRRSINIMICLRILIMIFLSIQTFYAFVIYPTDLECANSVIYEKDKPLPCLLFFSIYVHNALLSLCMLIIYLWLVKRKGATTFIYRFEKMGINMDLFTRRCFQYEMFVTVLWLLIAMVGKSDEEKKHSDNSRPLLLTILNWIFMIIIEYLIVATATWIIIPSCLLTLMFYAEHRRLRSLTKEFFVVIRERPYNINRISDAYIWLYQEFAKTQVYYGSIVNVLAIGLIIETVSWTVTTLYLGQDNKISQRVLKGSSSWYSTASGVLQYLPMAVLLLSMFINMNKVKHEIRNECTTLIASSAAASTGWGSSSVSNKSLEEGGKVKNSDDSSVSFSGKCDDRRDKGNTSMFSSTQTLTSSPLFYHVKDNMKLKSLCEMIERQPCQLKLLGRGVTNEDMYYLVGFLVLVQVVNAFGISWIVPVDA